MDGARRFGALTYSSFDDGRGLGGWNVKQLIDLDEHEAAAVRSRISTSLDVDGLSRFPAPEEIEALPRRLAYLPLDRQVGWWHTASAGPDASGRPGNVFAHVVVDRRPFEAAPDRRPIDVWRSSGWLTPFGAEAVNEAVLATAALPDAALTRTAAVDFLLDLTEFRLATFGALLDATTAAVTGSEPRRIVVACSSDRSAAAWIASVGFCMLAQHARTFFFSTWERASTVDAVFQRGAHLVAVPVSDAAELAKRDDLIVIDERDAVQIGDLWGTPHRMASGVQIAAREWSGLAQVAFSDRDTALRCFGALDRLSGELGEVGPDPSWGLAMVVAGAPIELADAATEASRVILSSSPPSLRQHPPSYEVAAVLVGQQAGTTAADVWRLLEERDGAADGPGPIDEMLLATYVRRAAADVSWLARPGGVPLPQSRHLPDAARDAVRDALVAGAADIRALDPGDARRPAAAAGLARIAVGTGFLGIGDTAFDAAADLVDDAFVPWLFDDGVVDLLRQVGPFDEPTQSQLVRLVLSGTEYLHQPGLPGRRLAPAVLDWLYPVGSPPVTITARAEIDQVRLELAVQRCRRPESPAAVLERPLAVLGILTQQALNPELQVDLTRFFVPPAYEPAELLVLVEQFPGRIPFRFVEPTIKGAAAGPALDELGWLCSARSRQALYRDDQLDEKQLALLAARTVAAQPWFRWSGHARDEAIGQIMIGGAYASAAVAGDLDAGFRRHLGVAAVLAAIEQKYVAVSSDVQRCVDDGPGTFLDDDEVAMLMLGLRSCSLGRIAWSAMYAAGLLDRLEVRSTRRPAWVAGRQLRGGVPVLIHFVRQRISGDQIYRRQLPEDVADIVAGVSGEERLRRRTRRAVEDWLRDLEDLDLTPGTEGMRR